MKIIKTDKYIKLIADEGKKLTSIGREFFSEFIFLPPTANIDDYEEVGREIWKHFIEDKPTDFDILQEKISNNNSMIANLEELLLDTDFRLMCLEIEKEYKEM